MKGLINVKSGKVVTGIKLLYNLNSNIWLVKTHF